MNDLIKHVSKLERGESEEMILESAKLKALFLNCTLKKSSLTSNTRVLIDKVIEHMNEYDVDSEVLTVVDYNVSHGINVEKEDPKDEWPIIYKKMKKVDIVVMCSPVWWGVRGSVLQKVVERMIGAYGDTDEKTGRYPMYGKVGGVIVTGNEDGAHSVVATTQANMAHMGFLIPPNSDAYWVGEAGAGPSYKEAGQKHLYTNKLIEYMSFNLIFYAQLIKANPNPIDIKKLTTKAKRVSDPLPDWTHLEGDEDDPTERERIETDMS